MLFKNYYAVLGVAPNASEDDIKKKFRKLALLYHPDRNADSEFATIRFKEIQEAYAILSDADKRFAYNKAWRDNYPKANISVAEETSPENILLKCQKLQLDIREMGAFRVNQLYVQNALNKILAEENIALLLFHKNAPLNNTIIMQVLNICNVLPTKSLPAIQEKLKGIAKNNTAQQRLIEKKIQQLKYKKLWEQYYPLLAFFIAIAVCVIIYLLSSKK